MSLLWYLINSGKFNSKKILLLDKRLKPDDSKTWCFWDNGSYQISETIYHTWPDIRVVTTREELKETPAEYKYHCVRSLDFSAKMLKMASEQENVTLLETDIIDFDVRNSTATAITSAGDFTSKYIFQSVIKPNKGDHQKSELSLNQHFLGWEIEVADPLFDPNEALLMDFEVSQKHGFAFMYILPFSSNRALIEYTLFTETLLSKEEYEAEIEAYLLKKYQLGRQNYSIMRKEFGNIPMEDRRYDRTYCKNVFNCGMVGGHTKPSTGYTFLRIQHECLKILKALESGRPIPESDVSSYRFRVYDMMLLYNLINDHEISLKIFHDLFKKNRFDMVFKFLDEKTSFPEELALFTSFSPVPFLRSIYRMKHRIFTGA